MILTFIVYSLNDFCFYLKDQKTLKLKFAYCNIMIFLHSNTRYAYVVRQMITRPRIVALHFTSAHSHESTRSHIYVLLMIGE